MSAPGYERIALLIRDLDGAAELLPSIGSPRGAHRDLLKALERSLGRCFSRAAVTAAHKAHEALERGSPKRALALVEDFLRIGGES